MKFLLPFFLILSHLLLAQNRQKGSYTVFINTPTSNVKADVLYENKKIKVREDVTYYWYTANKILETKGGFDGRLLNGNYSSFYLSENLKEKGTFSNGLKEGEWKMWFENGKVREISHWKAGQKHGIYKKYDVRGSLQLEARFENGQLNGIQKTYQNDTLLSSTKYDDGKEVIKKEKRTTSIEAPGATKKRTWAFWKKKEEPKEDNKMQPADLQIKEKRKFSDKVKSLFKRDKKKSKESGPNVQDDADATGKKSK
jgi:hypothetical protein